MGSHTLPWGTSVWDWFNEEMFACAVPLLMMQVNSPPATQPGWSVPPATSYYRSVYSSTHGTRTGWCRLLRFEQNVNEWMKMSEGNVWWQRFVMRVTHPGLCKSREQTSKRPSHTLEYLWGNLSPVERTPWEWGNLAQLGTTAKIGRTVLTCASMATMPSLGSMFPSLIFFWSLCREQTAMLLTEG